MYHKGNEKDKALILLNRIIDCSWPIFHIHKDLTISVLNKTKLLMEENKNLSQDTISKFTIKVIEFIIFNLLIT